MNAQQVPIANEGVMIVLQRPLERKLVLKRPGKCLAAGELVGGRPPVPSSPAIDAICGNIPGATQT